MDLKEELPKLGKVSGGKVYYEIDGESIQIGQRPNYADFKIRKYQDEETCASVLLGISKPNALLLSLVRRIDSLSMKDKENEPCYGLYGQLVDLFQSIRKTIDIGIAAGDIGKVTETEETELQFMRKLHTPAYGPEYRVEHWLNCEFSSNRSFAALGFLSWMQENGYPIPDELAFEKNGNGETIWAGHLDQNIGHKDLEKMLDETLIKIIPDIDRFYEAFKNVLKDHQHDEEQDYIQYVKEAFSDIQTEASTLMEQDIKGVVSQNMDPEVQLSRVRGKLAKNMVIRLKPELKKLAAHSQNLKTRMNSLK